MRRFFNHRGHGGHRVCCCRHASNDFAASFALNKGLLQQHRSRAGKPELHQFVSIRVHSWFKTNPHEAPAAQISGWKARAASIRAHSCPFVVQNHPHRAQKKGALRAITRNAPLLFTGTGRIRTCNQGIMLPTSAFAALFRFVVWTIPSRRMLRTSTCRVCRLASTPSATKTKVLEITTVSVAAWLGIGIPSEASQMV